MNCANTHPLLSAYFDNELAPNCRAEVAEHVQSCAPCTAKLARMRSLSSLTRDLPDPAVDDLWPTIERALDRSNSPQPVSPIRFLKHWSFLAGLLAIAASLLVGFFAWPLSHSSSAYAQMASNFSRYVERFADDPAEAEKVLRQEYPSQVIAPSDAIRLTGHEPLAPETMPDGAVRTQMCLFEMPCCECIQSLYHRADGGSIAVFEHVNEAPAWVGGRSAIHANCCGKDVCLIECGGQLAITWQEGTRHVTLVGVKNIDQAALYLPALSHTST